MSIYLKLKKFSLITLIVLYANNAQAEQSCTKDKSFCINTVKNKKNSSIDFFAENKSNIDITTTLLMKKLVNMKSTVSLPYTFLMLPKTEKKIFTLSRKDLLKPWSYNYIFNSIYGNFMATHNDDYKYTLPYNSGETYKVIQGYNGNYSHKGEQIYSIDLNLPEGTDILASRGGKIIGVKNDSSIGGADKKYANDANYVLIEHDDKTIGAYVHLLKGTVLVHIGQNVKVGQLIAKSGNTGWSSGAHLHFWVYKIKDGFKRESIPIQFKTSEYESEELQENESYTAF